MATSSILNLQSFCNGVPQSRFSVHNTQPPRTMKRLLSVISPSKSTSRTNSDLSRSSSTSTSRSDKPLHPQVTTTPSTRRPSNMASNNPFSGSSDAPPPYSPDSTTPATYQTSTGYQRQTYQQYPAGGLSQSYYQQPSSYGSIPAVPASAAAPSKSTGLNHNDDDKYAFLSKFDTVFLIDDSGSMNLEERWEDTKKAIEAIAPICTHYDNDGIDIHFLNQKDSHEKVKDAKRVSRIFNSVSPSGQTFTGTKLAKITREYLQDLEKGIEKKPMNIIVITDGKPDDEPEQVLIKIAQRLDKMDALPWQIGVQFVQVGSDPGATRHLQEMDDMLSKKAGDDSMRDIVDTQPFRSGSGSVINADGILKVVLGAVLKRQDNQQGKHLHH